MGDRFTDRLGNHDTDLVIMPLLWDGSHVPIFATLVQRQLIMADEQKPKKMEPYTPAWERLANAEARNFAPTIKPCRDCGGPVVSGYCCTRCGSAEP